MLGVFDDLIRPLAGGNHSPDSVEKHIQIFLDRLLRRTLSLNARLNHQFDYDDKTASVNMEETDEQYIQKLKALDVPELSKKLLTRVEDSLGLLKLTDDEWGNFKNNMNFLYDKICCWDDSKS